MSPLQGAHLNPAPLPWGEAEAPTQEGVPDVLGRNTMHQHPPPGLRPALTLAWPCTRVFPNLLAHTYVVEPPWSCSESQA